MPSQWYTRVEIVKGDHYAKDLHTTITISRQLFSSVLLEKVTTKSNPQRKTGSVPDAS